jgi:hypothetical protein
MAALEPLRRVMYASFEAGAEPPEALLDRLDGELAKCFATLLARYDRASAPWAELAVLADAFRDRTRLLPDKVSRAHFDWLRRTRGWYKAILAPDGRLQPPELPVGTLSVPLELVPHVYRSIHELRYAMHRRELPALCDCQALIAAGIEREPKSPELRALGESNDGYYFGDAFECGCCKTRWFRGVMDDDSGSLFWQHETSVVV